MVRVGVLQSRVRHIVVAVVVSTATLSGCGGGGGGGPTPPVSSPAAQTATGTFHVTSQATSFPLPAAGGFSGTISVPASAASGDVDVTVSTQQPAGAVAFQTATPSNAPLLFITLQAKAQIVFNGTFTIALSVPATVRAAAENFYLATYFDPGLVPNLPGPGPVVPNPPVFSVNPIWFTSVGPVVVQNHNLVFSGTLSPGLQTPLALVPNQPGYLALLQSGIAQLSLSLSAPLVMGTPSKPNVSVGAVDGVGNPIQGALPTDLTISSDETLGRVSLGSTKITNLSQTIPITYGGKADRFTVTAALSPNTVTLPVVTLLPQETLLATPGLGNQQNVLGQLVFGSDGNLWSTVGTTAVARMTPSGALKLYSDPSASYGLGTGLALGGDGNIWVPSNVGGTYGLVRVTPSGQFTRFPFTAGLGNNGSILAIAAAPDGTIWSVVFGLEPAVGFADIVVKTDANGTTTTVGFFPSPSSALTNVVFGPDKNLWFALGGGVGTMKQDGTVAMYPLAGVPTTPFGGSALVFVVGPDGNFWAPYANGAANLLKFATSGAVVSNTPLSYPLPQANSPTIVAAAVDSAGNLYAADSGAQGVIRITPSANVAEWQIFSTQFNAGFNNPIGLAVDPVGRLYVSDVAWTAMNAGSTGGFTVVDPLLW